MKINDWRRSNSMIFNGIKCIEHKANQNEKIKGEKAVHEVCLAGERGDIWHWGGSTYKAFLVLPSGSEKIYSFNIKDLKKWVSRIGVPLSLRRQIELANNPDIRLERFK